jgi:hypothetical protein
MYAIKYANQLVTRSDQFDNKSEEITIGDILYRDGVQIGVAMSKPDSDGYLSVSTSMLCPPPDDPPKSPGALDDGDKNKIEEIAEKIMLLSAKETKDLLNILDWEDYSP